MLKDIDLTNKCGSCDRFKPIEDTASGECLQNPYNDTVAHDPEHPHWIVQRSRIKCPLYNAKPQTNADRIRRMTDEELAEEIRNGISSDACDYCKHNNAHCDGSPCQGKAEADIIIEWLQRPAEEDT